MKRKKTNNFMRRRRGYRSRFSTESVQKDKYTPFADAMIHRNSLRSVRPFSPTALQSTTPNKYNQVSEERQDVELRFRELVLTTQAFDHYIERWHCKWLFGRPNSAYSVRMLFYGNRAVLVRYDHGVFERSKEYRGCELAEMYFEMDCGGGRKIAWIAITVPLNNPKRAPLDKQGFGNAANPLQDFAIKEGKPEYAPVYRKGVRVNDKHLKFSSDSLTQGPKEPEDD